MAQRTKFEEMACSIARSWAVVGEPWTPLILRDLAVGLHRFEQLREDLGVSTNVLSGRLATLERAGVIERRPYKDNQRTRDEYHLTEMGAELVPVLAALTQWGDRWLSGDTPPALLHHRPCGEREASVVVACSECGEPVTHENTNPHPGPGQRLAPGTMILGTLPPWSSHRASAP